MVWKKDAITREWTRRTLFRGYHSGYFEETWSKIQNTFNDDNEGEQNGKNKDHAKIYVSFPSLLLSETVSNPCIHSADGENMPCFRTDRRGSTTRFRRVAFGSFGRGIGGIIQRRRICSLPEETRRWEI